MLIPMGHPVISYASSYGRRFEEFIADAAVRSSRAVELIPDQTPNLLCEFDDHRLRELRGQLAEARISPLVHSVFYDINPVSVVPEVQDFAIGTIRASAEFCRALGGDQITIHAGYQFPGWRSSEWQRAIFADAAARGMAAISRICDEIGVYAYVENGSYYVTTKTGAAKIPLHCGIEINELSHLLASAGPRVGVCIDVGKALASEVDLSELTQAFQDRRRRFQISGERSWTALLEAQSGMRSPPTMSDVTFEGSLIEYDRLFPGPTSPG